jgi:hypothetical protein
MTEKIKIANIFFHRVDGTTQEVKTQILNVYQSEEKENIFDIVNKKISDWSITAPYKGNGYNKCDFTLEWENGKTYGGRFDMQFGYNNLSDHIKKYLTFYVKKPWYLDQKTYDQYIAYQNSRNSDFIPKCKDLLENYQLE